MKSTQKLGRGEEAQQIAKYLAQVAVYPSGGEGDEGWGDMVAPYEEPPWSPRAGVGDDDWPAGYALESPSVGNYDPPLPPTKKAVKPAKKRRAAASLGDQITQQLGLPPPPQYEQTVDMLWNMGRRPTADSCLATFYLIRLQQEHRAAQHVLMAETATAGPLEDTLPPIEQCYSWRPAAQQVGQAPAWNMPRLTAERQTYLTGRLKQIDTSVFTIVTGMSFCGGAVNSARPEEADYLKKNRQTETFRFIIAADSQGSAEEYVQKIRQDVFTAMSRIIYQAGEQAQNAYVLKNYLVDRATTVHVVPAAWNPAKDWDQYLVQLVIWRDPRAQQFSAQLVIG